ATPGYFGLVHARFLLSGDLRLGSNFVGLYFNHTMLESHLKHHQRNSNRKVRHAVDRTADSRSRAGLNRDALIASSTGGLKTGSVEARTAGMCTLPRSSTVKHTITRPSWRAARAARG
ncbi:MAG: hypothetical protein OEW88_11095, partial [Gammaproteobacteria bacterium]|nr:hypothetical protein [Gammaproteobacteria bacterium]